VKHYFRNESYALCQEAFEEAFPNDKMPNKTTVYYIITKFEETGCVCDRKHNRRRTALNDDTLENVRLSSVLFCFIIIIVKFGCVLK
jgi:hypothetical protein